MQAMNITIQIDETQFKDILDKELKDMPKEQLQEIIMNVGHPGMPVAVFLIDEVADRKLRNIVTAKMIGKGMNGMHKSHLLSCGFIIR